MRVIDGLYQKPFGRGKFKTPESDSAGALPEIKINAAVPRCASFDNRRPSPIRTVDMNLTRSLNRSFLVPLFCAIAFAALPALRAETPPDQIKAAGAIPLTTELLDKMDAFIKALGADEDAKKELTSASADPSINPDNWGSSIAAKCPKVAELFKKTSITADDFGKALFAIMAVAMSEDLAKSEDKTVKANADFVAANKDRTNQTFGNFMQLSMPAAP